MTITIISLLILASTIGYVLYNNYKSEKDVGNRKVLLKDWLLKPIWVMMYTISLYNQ